jgi:hypothetical protein
MFRDMNAAFGGYCTMSFADYNDLGRGLKFEIQKLNPREISQTALNQLKTVVGANNSEKPFSGLARFHPHHAMTIVLPLHYVVSSSLQKDAFAKEFPVVEWIGSAATASSDVMILANGNHRRILCLLIGKPLIDQLGKINANITKISKDAGTSTNTHKMNELIDKRAALLPKVREATSWLVAVYDQGDDCFLLSLVSAFAQSSADKINKSPYVREILYELSKNQQAYQANDDDFDALQLTINHFLSIPQESRLGEIQKACSQSSPMLTGMSKRMLSVFHDSSLFVQLIDLYPYSRLWTTRAITITMVYNWRMAAAPVCVYVIHRTAFLTKQ